jgi:hypothetical protein
VGKSFKFGNDLLGSMDSEELLKHMLEHQLLKKDCDPYLVFESVSPMKVPVCGHEI